MYPSYLLLAALVVLLGLYPDDFWPALVFVAVQVKTLCLNLVLLVTSYWFYIKLSRELRSLGLEAPPFKFIPIQDRQQ